MSTTYYHELPEEYLDLYLHYSYKFPKPAEFYAHTLALNINGWSIFYINQVTKSVYPQKLLHSYSGQDLSKFDLPITPEPDIHSPHIIKLRSLYDTSGYRAPNPDLPLLHLTPEQSQHLHKLYLDYRENLFYNPKDLHNYHTSPKYKALSKLANSMLFYYSLGVSITEITLAITNQKQDSRTTSYRILKAYYQWHTPFIHPRRQNTYSLISSQQISHMTTDLLEHLSPSPRNLESLSRTPHSTRFGMDLTRHPHLFRRESYQTLFRDLPETVSVLGPNKEKLSPSDVAPLVDAVLV